MLLLLYTRVVLIVATDFTSKYIHILYIYRYSILRSAYICTAVFTIHCEVHNSSARAARSHDITSVLHNSLQQGFRICSSCVVHSAVPFNAGRTYVRTGIPLLPSRNKVRDVQEYGWPYHSIATKSIINHARGLLRFDSIFIYLWPVFPG